MANTELRIKIVGDASGATAVLAGTNEQINRIKASLDSAGDYGVKAGGEIAEGGKMAEYSMMEARHSVMLVGEELGVKVPRAVAGMVASIGPLGPLLEAAFPILGVIALIEVIEKIVDHFEQASEEASKFAIEEQQLQNSSELTTQALEIENLKIQDQITKLEHGVSHNALQEGLLEANKAAGALAAGLEKDSVESQKLLKDTTFFEKAKEWGLLLSDFTTKFGDNYNKVDEALNNSRQALANLAAAQAEMDAVPSKEHQEEYAKAIVATQNALTQSVGTVREYGKENGDNAAKVDFLTKKITELGAASKDLGLIQQKSALDGKKASIEASREAQEELERQRDRVDALLKKMKELADENDRAAQTEARLADEEGEFWEKVQLDKFKALETSTKELVVAQEELAKAQDKVTEALAKENEDAAIAAIKRKVTAGVETQQQGNAEIEALYQQDAAVRIQIETDTVAKLKEQQKGIFAAMLEAQASGNAAQAQSDEAMLDKILAQEAEASARIIAIRTQTASQIASIDQKTENQEEKALNSYIDSASNEFAGLVVKIGQGHETIEKAAIQAYTKMETAFISYIIRSVAQSIAGNAEQEASNVKTGMSYAATAAKAAGASVAGVPIVGPELAIALSAVVFAALSAFDTGGMVDGTQMALVHDHEAVLTPSQTETLQRAADGPGFGDTGGGDMHTHFHINAMDSADVASFLKKNGPALGQAWHNQVRNGYVNLPAAGRGK